LSVYLLQKVDMAQQAVPPLVSPFVGERYAAVGRLSDLISPPYDVISEEQREALAARHRENIVRLILPQGNGDRYDRAASLLAEWRTGSVFDRDAEPSVYVVRQEFSTPGGKRHVRTGVVAAIAVEPYESGRVKPHEQTHKGPKADRLALMKSTKAMFEALLMMVRDSEGRLRAALRAASAGPPLARAELDGVAITLWRLQGESAAEMAQAADEGILYIADGHHRYETTNIYRQENPSANRTLALLVPLGDPGLVVLPTHRVVHGGDLDEATVRRATGLSFDISLVEAARSPSEILEGAESGRTTCLVVLPGGRRLKLVLKADADLSSLPAFGEPSVLALDVARVDPLVVSPLIDAAGPSGSRSYSADSADVIESVESGKAAAGVLLKPMKVEQVLAVADDGAFMPQKSTYFLPKVPSGLVVLDLGLQGSMI
jgi:uncharacterized protein (DUF1015 family)